MKTTILVSVLLMTIGPVSAQDQPRISKESSATGKPLMVSGKVMDRGKTLLFDIDSEWAVSNPELLEDLDGQIVRVKCYVNSERNIIHILYVKRDTRAPNYAAGRLGDSAFRR